MLGEVASGLSLAGAPVCQQSGIPMVTPSSVRAEITAVGDRIFRVCFTNRFQAYACAKFARDDLKAQTAAILYDQKLPYSVGLADEFQKQFTLLGGRITTRVSYQEGDQDFSAQLTSIRGTNSDLVFIPGYYTDVANIAVQARKLGIVRRFWAATAGTRPNWRKSAARQLRALISHRIIVSRIRVPACRNF